jgi:hypothetical protein
MRWPPPRCPRTPFAPWGLQKDPIVADGYLFFRGWFHLLLATYKYVSGDDKWTKPFKVVRYGDEAFEWDHHRLANWLDEQYRTRPEGLSKGDGASQWGATRTSSCGAAIRSSSPRLPNTSS